MKNTINIDSNGIKKTLKSCNEYQAIAEYIWNGYDAGAKNIFVSLISNDLGRITDIEIKDDGIGIDYNDLEEKFKTFYSSQKIVRQNIEATHGRNGVGRFTFFKFSSKATWETIYFEKNQNINKKYKIEMDEKTLHEYITTEPELSNENIGTVVKFKIKDDVKIYEEHLRRELLKEFSLHLELKLKDNVELIVNEEKINQEINIFKRKEINLTIDKKKFNVNFAIWKDKISESSKYYYIGTKGTEILNEHTRYNRKSDNFYHSIFIKSDFFDDFKLENEKYIENSPTLYITNSNKDEAFKKMRLEIEIELNKIRKEFLKHQAKPILERYKKNGVFPKYGNNIWDIKREEELFTFVEDLYIIEPKIFSSLNLVQQKTFIKLLGVVMDSDGRDSLFTILDSVVELKDEDKKELAETLKRTSLQNVLNTIKIVEDRYKAIEYLKNLVFNKKLNVYEVEHIQKFVENHFWIFGDEFCLITAAEPKFKQAAEKYWFEIKEEEKNITIDHVDSKKEMDIFLCCRDVKNDKIRNIVVELKRPSIKLGKNEYRQIEDYKSVISTTPEFNASNEEWIFILVGREFKSDNFIDAKYKSASNHGEKFLTEKSDNCKIYVKKWSEVIAEFEMKHNFLNEKLKIQREELIKNLNDPDKILEECTKDNTAKVV